MYDLKIFAKNIEPAALDQVHALIEQPAFKDSKVRIMPDVHAGKGCVIGFTADLGDKVIPNVVGVDIGCGMLTARIGDVKIDFEKLDNIIREKIPSGRNVNTKESDFQDIDQMYCKDKFRNVSWLRRSLGTLGGGNHFIEVDEDENGVKYLVVHTGSRNLGKQVAEIYQQIAIESILGLGDIKKERERLIDGYRRAGRNKEIKDALEDLSKGSHQNKLTLPKELCYLVGEDREKYLHDMMICQEFATLNRSVIAARIFSTMGWEPKQETFETIHNYIDPNTNIVRKGAISATKGEKLLIPINMREGCIVGVGKGNEDWNQSAPHGAGRVMSRSKAKEVISLDEFQQSMKGIYSTSVGKSTIDESPMAYKPMYEIVSCIRDTVDILKIIKPVYNFKATE